MQVLNPQITHAPPGGAPTLARLAYSRLGFGPRPGDADFDDAGALTSYIDGQLNIEAIDDSVCDAALAQLYLTQGKDGAGNVLPPLNASTQQIKTYIAAPSNVPVYKPGALADFLTDATYLRAILSKRQLYEAMVDFWSNHLNTTWMDSEYKYWEDQHVIRKYALGNFRDLLGASAKSPSMMQFLSNRFSDGGNPNENYARELMELHTLGSVNRIPGHAKNGQFNYTEVDVHSVAGILSGWTNYKSTDDSFKFNDSPDWPSHDWTGKQLWLGNDDYYDLPFGGQEQGETLLDILAEHPSTAWFLSRKLCRRFISDDPDTFCPNVVQAGAEAFIETYGDIRATLRAILTADVAGADFKSSWGQKIKRPFEFYISTLRAMNVSEYPPPNTVNPSADDYELRIHIESIGQKLFECHPPTGYPDFMVAWMNSNQVFSRWTMGNALVRRYFGEYQQDQSTSWAVIAPVNLALDAYIGAGKTADQVVDLLITNFIGRSIDPTDRQAFVDYLSQGGPANLIASTNLKLRALIGTLIGSPYFQWR